MAGRVSRPVTEDAGPTSLLEAASLGQVGLVELLGGGATAPAVALRPKKKKAHSAQPIYIYRW